MVYSNEVFGQVTIFESMLWEAMRRVVCKQAGRKLRLFTRRLTSNSCVTSIVRSDQYDILLLPLS